MAPDPGASPSLLAEMAERMTAGTQHTEEVASGAERRSRWRGRPSHLAGYAARELAPGQSPRSLPRGDGRVRVVKVQVGEGTLTRPVTKLCTLEGEL